MNDLTLLCNQEIDVCGCDCVSEEVVVQAAAALEKRPRALTLHLAATNAAHADVRSVSTYIFIIIYAHGLITSSKAIFIKTPLKRLGNFMTSQANQSVYYKTGSKENDCSDQPFHNEKQNLLCHILCTFNGYQHFLYNI